MTDFRRIAAETRRVYEEHAAEFDQLRTKSLFERDRLDQFLAALPKNGSVLDLGCGSGRPIGEYLIQCGASMTGVDYSLPLIEMARARFSEANWIHQDMRSLDIGQSFDGIIAWHSFFHLTPDEQIETLPRISAHLVPGGVFITTVHSIASETTGWIGDAPVYQASLSQAAFRSELDRNGLQIIDFILNDEACGGATVMLARKRSPL